MTKHSTTRDASRGETALRALLAKDVEAIRDERGGVEHWHLIERGWSREQLAAHLPAVVADLTAAA